MPTICKQLLGCFDQTIGFSKATDCLLCEAHVVILPNLCHQFSRIQVQIMAKACGYHPEKKLERAIPEPSLAHGFRSNDEHCWFTRYFRDRKLMVERPLDDTWSDPSAIPFFLRRLRAYPGWVAMLTDQKRVNIDWVGEACATLVSNPATPRTFYSYI